MNDFDRTGRFGENECQACGIPGIARTIVHRSQIIHARAGGFGSCATARW